MPNIIFAAGCFWGVEQAFRSLEGVVKTEAGYCGGTTPNPAYRDVCAGETGHAEAVRVEYDPDVISCDQLIQFFWGVHDPTSADRQGTDIGSQYRSAIFCENEQQFEQALNSKCVKSRAYPRKIVTEVALVKDFYPAEDYHQQYYEKQGIVKGACGRKA